MFWHISVLCILIQAVVQIETKIFTNQWVAKIHGGEEAAKRVARNLGYIFKGQAIPFEDHYVMIRDDLPKESEKNSDHLTRSLMGLKEVDWAEQQFFSKESNPEFHERYKQEDMDELMKLTDQMEHSTPWDTVREEGGSCFANFFRVLFGFGQGNVAKLGMISTKPSDFTTVMNRKGPTLHVELLSKKRSAYASNFNDVLWKYQWYLGFFLSLTCKTQERLDELKTKEIGLGNYVSPVLALDANDNMDLDYRVKEMPVMDHNVVPVYQMGYTGKGVNIAVLDDGVMHQHPDLEENHDENLSYDFCNERIGSMPDLWLDGKLKSHGTKCAGVIAMKANNELCGTGIAYNAKVAGAKIICEYGVNDYLIGRALFHQIKKFHIYFNSWGGYEKPMTPLYSLIKSALVTGVTIGRENNGAIYLFSSGNYNRLWDNCASSASINHYTTIIIGSASQKGKIVEYSGRCTAVFATAYTGGDPKEERVVSVTSDGGCTRAFSGTAASQAIAAGIIALVLEANKDLTYRDVMHLIAMTAEVAPLANNKNTWYQNGRGFWVSNDFGFGLLNAENMVIMAKKWTPVPAKHVCFVDMNFKTIYEFNEETPSLIFIDINACQKDDSKVVYFLEQLQITPDIDYPYRGALSITITSPAGTKSEILEMRPGDISNEGLPEGWSFKSIQNWGEDPNGVWQIDVRVNKIYKWPTTKGRVKGIAFTFHGTDEKPAHYDQPRVYSAFRLLSSKPPL